MNQAELTRLVSQLRIRIQPRYRRFGNPEGPEGRLKAMRKTVNGLIKYERIELNYPRADEARGYAERLISEAIRHGPSHRETMDQATYWLEEKQLVHKLFKVLVPRYKDSVQSYTQMYKAPELYNEVMGERAVLQLRNNIYPPLSPVEPPNPLLLHNILLEEARKEYRKEKKIKEEAKVRETVVG